MRFFEVSGPATLCAALLSGVTFALAPGARAGEILDRADGARIYVFKECAAPEPFVIEDAEAARFGSRPRARRRALRRYDTYVAALNAYFDCMQDEAQTDLETLYGAVDKELQSRQGAALAHIETLRKQLRLDAASPGDGQVAPGALPTPEDKTPEDNRPEDRQLEQELLGGDD